MPSALFGQRLLETEQQHKMKATGHQCRRRTGHDLDRIDRAHPHNALVGEIRMYLGLLGEDAETR